MVSLSLTYRSESPQDTIRLGEALGSVAGPGDVVVLSGDLGAGKTMFVRGMASGLGADPAEVHSPTFTLQHIYTGRLLLHHFDLYRLEDATEFTRLGFDECLSEDVVTVVEWGDRFPEHIPWHAVWVSMSMVAGMPQERLLVLHCAADDASLLRDLARLVPPERVESER